MNHLRPFIYYFSGISFGINMSPDQCISYYFTFLKIYYSGRNVRSSNINPYDFESRHF